MPFIALELGIGAVFYILFSIFMQRKLGNPMRMQEIQARIKVMSKEINELSKGPDKQLIYEKQKEITPLLSESMKIQYKPMFVVLPIFFAIYYMLLPALFPSNPTVQIFSFTLNYRYYFMMLSFILGVILSLGISIYDKKRLAARQNKELLQMQK